MSLPIHVVIFGASGDLSQRKLVPALYALHVKERLPPEVRVVGFSRHPHDDTSFRQLMQQAVRKFAPHDQAATDSLRRFQSRPHAFGVRTARTPMRQDSRFPNLFIVDYRRSPRRARVHRSGAGRCGESVVWDQVTRIANPPDKHEKATETVLEQAALLSGEWAVA